MKKNYINPALEVINIKSTEILAGSTKSVEVSNDNITAGDQVGAKGSDFNADFNFDE